MMKIFALLTITGAAALAMTVMMGFEEPNGMLLLLSSLLMFAAPAAMVVHLTFTHELTRERKHLWLKALTGRHAPYAWSVYLTCHDHNEALSRLSSRAADAVPH